MSKSIELKVHLSRDDATGRWYIADTELPGLRLESDTVHDLIRQIEDIAAELIELNHDEIANRHGAVGQHSFTIRPIIDTPLAIAS